MATIQSVTGPIDAADLGRVLVHEHIRIRYPGETLEPTYRYDRAECLARAVAKLKAVAEHGVRTIVDPCPIELDRDPELMRDVSAASGVNVICSTGFYHEHDGIGIPFYWRARTREEVAEFYLHELEHGIAETGIRPGVIKIASGVEPGRHDKKVIAGAGIAAREAGVSLISHCEHSQGGHVQQDILAEQGVDLSRALIGHQDEQPDPAPLIAIAERGSFVGIDRVGMILAPDTQRADNIAALVDAGHADRVCLSHDASCCFQSPRFPYPLPEGMPESMSAELMPAMVQTMNLPFTYLFTEFLPQLAQRGVDDATINSILVDNPRRLLTGS